jgi:hypothetical protein
MPNARDRLMKLAAGSTLQSLTNARTKSLTLYVLQNEYGLVKIGRSRDLEQRRASLTRRHQCAIAKVHVLENSGHLEEWIHLTLASHRLAYEWFSGDPNSRGAIETLIGTKLTWPYEYNAAQGLEWIEKVHDVQALDYWRRQERNLVRNLKSAVTGTGRYADYNADKAWLLESEIGRVYDGYTDLSVGELVTGIREGDASRTQVPQYTRDMAAAMRLWAADTPVSRRRPVHDALDCCLAALCDFWCFEEAKLTVPGRKSERRECRITPRGI